MSNPRYLKTQATAKQGVNFIKGIVKSLGHKFISIHQEDDIGLDCFIQMMENNNPTKIISVQVKSGDSFYNFKTQKCKIPIKNHRDYWLQNDLPIYGIVFVPALSKAFWCDLKSKLIESDTVKDIVFTANMDSEFDHITFTKYTTTNDFSKVQYLEIINEMVMIDHVLKTFLNMVIKDISSNINNLKNFNDFQSFLYNLDYETIDHKTYIELSKDNDFSGAVFPQNHGEFMFMKSRKVIWFTSEFENKINSSLNNLKQRLK